MSINQIPPEKLTTVLELTDPEVALLYEAVLRMGLSTGDAAVISRVTDIINALESIGFNPMEEIY